MFRNLFKRKKDEKPLEILVSGNTVESPCIAFDQAFQDRFAYFKGKWLCDEQGVLYVLNFYHVRNGIVISLDFNVALIEENTTQTITVSGDELLRFTRDNWELLQAWHDRQTRVKNSLRAFKFKIEKFKSFKTKSEKRSASNL